MKLIRNALFATAAMGFVAAAAPAFATEGYFQPGYSAIQKGQAGVGIANPEDAMSLALNPAGLTSLSQEFEIGVSLFSPTRGYKATGPGFVAPGDSSGTEKSGWPDFVIPGIGYSQPIDANSSWGITMYANGGMNTNYSGSITNSNCSPYTGVFCGGKAGVNLSQMFVTAGYAWKSGDLSFGIAPVVAMQMFDAHGLGAFSGLSVSPANLTNNGISYSYGFGLHAGAIWSAAPNFRIALSGGTPTWMSKFGKYKGLFAGGGAFDVPGWLAAGVAWDAAPDLTLMADYKHIFYSGVKSVSGSTTAPYPFGSSNGPGFGWSDVDVISLAAEYRAAPDWTLRAGYAHNTNPIGSSDVTLNILAPGVVTDHLAAGFTHKFDNHSSLDFSAMYVPEHNVSGVEVTPEGPNPYRTIKLYMHQTDFTLTYRYDF